jgi:chromosome segregation ATPase
MSTTIRTLVLTAVLASAALLGGPVEGRAQATATPPDVLAALLVEVRGLRVAMEQMASAGPRVQLALGRLQLQEQRVNTLVRRLEEVRSTLAQAQKESEVMTERMSGLERLAREGPAPEVRRDADAELKNLKMEMARATPDLQRLQTEEASLTQDNAAEQGRWTELNQRLEALERSLGGNR